MLTEVGGSFEIIIKFFPYLCANNRVDHQRYSIPLQSPVGLTKKLFSSLQDVNFGLLRLTKR